MQLQRIPEAEESAPSVVSADCHNLSRYSESLRSQEHPQLEFRRTLPQFPTLNVQENYVSPELKIPTAKRAESRYRKDQQQKLTSSLSPARRSGSIDSQGSSSASKSLSKRSQGSRSSQQRRRPVRSYKRCAQQPYYLKQIQNQIHQICRNQFQPLLNSVVTNNYKKTATSSILSLQNRINQSKQTQFYQQPLSLHSYGSIQKPYLASYSKPFLHLQKYYEQPGYLNKCSWSRKNENFNFKKPIYYPESCYKIPFRPAEPQNEKNRLRTLRILLEHHERIMQKV